ncbi:MAG TPA: LysM peptidoglycan-binding domain-containing protein, partial [Aggregatilineales bacterium]|nr:LysM peptidoglycan-binding domain-containing protein [Aggregatilineales bacterium]
MSQKTIYRIFFAGILLVLLVFPGVVFAQEPTTTHVVQPGENLYRIGLQYGFTAEQLALANGIVNPSQVYAGQVLVLPLPIGGGNEAPAPAEIQPAEIVTAPPVSVGNEVPPAEIVTAQPVSVGNEVLPAEVVTDPPANVTHVVQANEGLAAIARQY